MLTTHIDSTGQFSLPIPAMSIYADDGSMNLSVIRKHLFRMTQQEFAEMLDVALVTYKSWEERKRSPSGAAKSLLRIAVTRPDVLQDVLGKKFEMEKSANDATIVMRKL